MGQAGRPGRREVTLREMQVTRQPSTTILVAMPLFLVAMPGATSSVLAPSNYVPETWQSSPSRLFVYSLYSMLVGSCMLAFSS